MKRLFFFLVFPLLPLFLFAQNKAHIYVPASVTNVYMSDIEHQQAPVINAPVLVERGQKEKLSGDYPPGPAEKTIFESQNMSKHSPMAVLSPAPTSSFLGLSDNNAAIPPDVQGAVSSSHLVLIHNTQIRYQTKLGQVLFTQSLNQFFSSAGNFSCYDPRVMYDHFNQKWIIVAAANSFSANSRLLIAIGTTANPTTASWNYFVLVPDNTGNDWFDYPVIGMNNRWIVISGLMFSNSTGNLTTTKIYAIDKITAYQSAAISSTVFTPSYTFGNTIVPMFSYDNQINDLYLVANWNGNFNNQGQICLYKLSGNIGSETIVQQAFPTTSQTWAFQAPGGVDFAPQLGTTNKIQNNFSRIHNVVYRNGSLWCTQNVFLPANNPLYTGVQWWELDLSGNILQRGIIQDPLLNNFYAFPSIAVNAKNDVLVGFSSFSTTQYASASYAFRSACDPPNTMQSVYTYKSGLAPYYKTHTGSLNRWGDYSATTVDPSNDVDFWTLQEYADLSSAGIDRWGTWWARINPPCNAPQQPTSLIVPAIHCAGMSATYKVSQVCDATVYQWTIQGTGWIPNGTLSLPFDSIMLTAPYMPAFPANISVTAVNVCGVSPPVTTTITPIAGPIPPNPMPVTPPPYCEGDKLLLVCNPDTTAQSYAWTVSGTNWSGSSTADTILLTVGSGPASVNVVSTNPCGSSNPASPILLHGTSVPSNTFTVSSSIVQLGQNVTVNYTGSAGNMATFLWGWDGGNAMPGNGPGPHQVSWNSPWYKTVSLQVADSGCVSDTATYSVFVDDNSGIISLEEKGIGIYPNPARSFIYFVSDIKLEGNIRVSIFDETGRMLMDEVHAADKPLYISRLQQGVYLVKIQYKDKEFSAKLSRLP